MSAKIIKKSFPTASVPLCSLLTHRVITRKARVSLFSGPRYRDLGEFKASQDYVIGEGGQL